MMQRETRKIRERSGKKEEEQAKTKRKREEGKEREEREREREMDSTTPTVVRALRSYKCGFVSSFTGQSNGLR